MSGSLERARASFRSALCDSFNTPEAMQSLLSLINEANKVLKSARTDEGVRVAAGEAARWIDTEIRMLGLSEGVPEYIGERRLIGWLFLDVSASRPPSSGRDATDARCRTRKRW